MLEDHGLNMLEVGSLTDFLQGSLSNLRLERKRGAKPVSVEAGSPRLCPEISSDFFRDWSLRRSDHVFLPNFFGVAVFCSRSLSKTTKPVWEFA